MSDAVTIDVPTKPQEIFNKEDAQLLADMAYEMIMSRFSTHTSPDGTPWKDYTEQYKKRLKEKGDSTEPDMQRTGKFKGAIKKKVARRKMRVGISGKAATKGYEKANEERPVIGLSEDECDELTDAYLESMFKRLTKDIKPMPADQASTTANKNNAAAGKEDKSEPLGD